MFIDFGFVYCGIIVNMLVKVGFIIDNGMYQYQFFFFSDVLFRFIIFGWIILVRLIIIIGKINYIIVYFYLYVVDFLCCIFVVIINFVYLLIVILNSYFII